MSLYLHKEIVDMLKCFGPLDNVINRILDECEAGNIDWYNKPACPSRENAGRYNIDVRNLSYLDTLQLYPPNSAIVSLRRLIYWFVETEQFVELSWKPVTNYISTANKQQLKAADNVISALQRLFLIEQKAERKQILTDMIQQLGEMYDRK